MFTVYLYSVNRREGSCHILTGYFTLIKMDLTNIVQCNSRSFSLTLMRKCMRTCRCALGLSCIGHDFFGCGHSLPNWDRMSDGAGLRRLWHHRVVERGLRSLTRGMQAVVILIKVVAASTGVGMTM